jgi:hypothetical protein
MVTSVDFTRLADEAAGVGIPRHMIQGVVSYCLMGRPTGSFLERIISNDFLAAYQHADYSNKPALHRYAEFFLLHAPEGCYGSKEIYDQWVKQMGLANLSSSPTPAPDPKTE